MRRCLVFTWGVILEERYQYMDRIKTFILGLAILLFAGFSSGYVGTAPGMQDLGTLERGQSYESHFYILTDEPEPFLIEPDFTPAHTNVLREEEKESYEFVPEEASEENIASWVDFSRSSYRVDPSDVQLIRLDDGSVARTSQRVTYSIDVPSDAEPGYHMGAVDLNPDFDPDTDGPTSLRTVGLTQLNFVFRVPGKAERDLDILDVNSKRVDEDEVRVDFLMENNGTVTTKVQSADTTIYDSVGNKSGEVIITGDKLAPGETRIVQTYWNSDDIDVGEYRVEGTMSYITGSSYIDSSIDVPDQIEIETTEEPEEESIPLWMVAMVLLLVGAVMYYFEISPFWIAVILGMGALIVILLWLEVSPVIMAVPLIMAAGYLVYRWL